MTETKARSSTLLIILAALIALFGLALGGGGLWLVLVGGSVYYLIAGLVLVGTAWLLFRRQSAALSLYALLLLGTIAWALGEVGFDFWALAPRGDILVPLGIVLAVPAVARRLGGKGRWPGPVWPLIGSLAVAAIVLLVAAFGAPHDLEGALPGPRPGAAAALAGEVAQQDWTAYGHSARGNRWTPLNQLTPANVA